METIYNCSIDSQKYIYSNINDKFVHHYTEAYNKKQHNNYQNNYYDNILLYFNLENHIDIDIDRMLKINGDEITSYDMFKNYVFFPSGYWNGLTEYHQLCTKHRIILFLIDKPPVYNYDKLIERARCSRERNIYGKFRYFHRLSLVTYDQVVNSDINALNNAVYLPPTFQSFLEDLYIDIDIHACGVKQCCDLYDNSIFGNRFDKKCHHYNKFDIFSIDDYMMTKSLKYDIMMKLIFGQNALWDKFTNFDILLNDGNTTAVTFETPKYYYCVSFMD